MSLQLYVLMDRFGGFQPALKMASKCPPRPLAAPHLCAWAHAQRGRDGQHLPLSRDAAGARGAGISLGGAVYCRAWLVGAWLETRLARPRVAPPPVDPDPTGAARPQVQGLSSRFLRFIARPACTGHLGWGRERGLLPAMS